MTVNKKYDIGIIGAGIAGASIARELSKYELSVAVIEKEVDVCFGVTKGTHGIIHCGFPEENAYLKNRGELMGNLMMEQICNELDVPFKRVGKLLVAFNEKESAVLREMEIDAKRNGVFGVELILNRERLKEMEPNLSDEIIAALYTPTTGVVSPWELAIGLIENAVENGVDLYTDTTVNSIRIVENDFVLETNKGEICAAYIINAAGANADKVAGMVGDESFKIQGTRHQRIIFDKSCDGVVRHIVRGINGMWPGDFVMPTVYGDIMVGSKVEEVEDRTDRSTTREGLEGWVIPHYQRMIPCLSPSKIIKPFAGFIPEVGNDYYIKSALRLPRFINMVLGASGFTASIAMSRHLIEEVLPYAGVKMLKKSNFNPYRKGIVHIIDLNDEERAEIISANPLYGHIICRCEYVSEGEIVEAIRRGATTRDGVKYRTRAGMGRCQGGFCGHRVLKILSRELGIPVTQVTRKGKGSEEVLYEIKELL